MPNTSGQMKKGGKSKPRRGRRGRARIPPSTLMIVPPAFKRTYCAYQSSNSVSEGAAGAGAIYQFRLNSLYDPDYTGVGTTAAGYTALSAMYGYFRVVSARVIVRAALTTNGMSIVGMVAGLNGTLTANILQLQIQPNANSKMLQGNTGGQHSVCTFDRTYNMPRICGLTKQQYLTEMDFAHLGGSNPARSVYLTVFMVGQSGVAQTVQFNTRIIYEVELSDPLQTVIN